MSRIAERYYYNTKFILFDFLLRVEYKCCAVINGLNLSDLLMTATMTLLGLSMDFQMQSFL